LWLPNERYRGELAGSLHGGWIIFW
jgi:hypothetical protein